MTDEFQSDERQAASVPPPGAPSAGEHPHTDYGREDDRWEPRNRARDWFILLVMIAIYLTWTGIVYLFEPGIR